MYDWNDILIVGDSFCADRKEDYTWPQTLTCKLTNTDFQEGRIPRGRGFPGASWWASRKELIKELKKQKVKILVVCHTEPFRIPHDRNWGINTRSVFLNSVYNPDYNQDEKVPSTEFIDACKQYFKYIVSHEFHLWTVQRWFDELDQLSLKHEIEKIIHLYCFEGDYNSYVFKKGTTFTVPLITYQKKQIWRYGSQEVTANHYSPSENIKFGEELYTILKNYPGDNVTVNKKLLGN